MLKKVIPFIAAAAMVFGADAAMAQTGKSCCAKKTADSKCSSEKKAECHDEKSEKPAGVEFSEVDRGQLRLLIDAGSATVIDARDAEAFGAGHIDGAILLTNYTFPEDKSATLVFYCGGPRCSAAPKAAKKAVEEGYTNVMVYRGGWQEWSEQAQL